ncbi:four-carbon acid sugar kinase family protein [Petroclostridium sp. X23]|uniref:four-carbon acid sugar kinase family protein n=1 Tax=Petroclostridium sp. X23 TaxID=3045146 RepID=UPI0024AE0F05|nr:four-carbon acid sugar kinase family protein [Petroclostridium sp. X23]WHH57988.1 four-carbon acid sugar kinase family protein [Petroclostridium sp. X23]
MIKLLIVADDFTGALDTGVQFAKNGIDTKVITDLEYDFANASHDTEVLVVNTETRPLLPEQAYKRVYELTKKALAAGVCNIYKKTDSALRGNIGSELTALLDASDEEYLAFLPAFPKIGRITRVGIHYIAGIPVRESVFGQDPFEPVMHSSISQIIGEQSKACVVNVPIEEDYSRNTCLNRKHIAVFDAENDHDLYRIGSTLKNQGRLKIMAGCAGFAAFLPGILELKGNKKAGLKKTDGLLVVSGSLNPITKEQIEYAESQGFRRVTLGVEQKLGIDYLETGKGKKFIGTLREYCEENVPLIIDTFTSGNVINTSDDAQKDEISKEEFRFRVANNLGMIVKALIQGGLRHTIIMTGGDTLMGFMKLIHCNELVPISEIGQGAVLSNLNLNGKDLQVISKSGGFGEKEIFVNIAKDVVADHSFRRNVL